VPRGQVAVTVAVGRRRPLCGGTVTLLLTRVSFTWRPQYAIAVTVASFTNVLVAFADQPPADGSSELTINPVTRRSPS